MPQPIALRVVTDACQIIWQYYLPDARLVVQFVAGGFIGKRASLREHPVFAALVSPAEKREATTGNTSPHAG